jgi:cytochrome c oxidase subunit 2
VLAGFAGVALTACPAFAQDNGQPAISHGLSYMTGFGPRNYPVVSLLWGTIILSLLVIAIIGGLVLVGSFLRGQRAADGDITSVPVERRGYGLPFIYIGVGVTFVLLIGYAVWNYQVLAAIAGPRRELPIKIKVIGHQWWWEFQYSGRGRDGFTTANELHIPVGEPIQVTLHTSDVIHSFWIPALTGKMDTIPGQNNTTWLQADRAGFYRGQCTEYCGQQHAHMAFVVTAEPKQQFESWWQQQLQGPKPVEAKVAAGEAERGQAVFMQSCAVCHTIRGTMAHGKIGPDLSHLMQRQTIAAGTAPNTIGYLSGWISDPQHIKPGNFMPTLTLSSRDLTALRTFLQTLQ